MAQDHVPVAQRFTLGEYLAGGKALSDKMKLHLQQYKKVGLHDALEPALFAHLCEERCVPDTTKPPIAGKAVLRALAPTELKAEMVKVAFEARVKGPGSGSALDVLNEARALGIPEIESGAIGNSDVVRAHIEGAVVTVTACLSKVPVSATEEDVGKVCGVLRGKMNDRNMKFIFSQMESWRHEGAGVSLQEWAQLARTFWQEKKTILAPAWTQQYIDDVRGHEKKESANKKARLGDAPPEQGKRGVTDPPGKKAHEKEEKGAKKACRFWAKHGTCKYGGDCKFLHEGTPAVKASESKKGDKPAAAAGGKDGGKPGKKAYLLPFSSISALDDESYQGHHPFTTVSRVVKGLLNIGSLRLFWDSGASTTFVCASVAQKLNLTITETKVDIRVFGGQELDMTVLGSFEEAFEIRAQLADIEGRATGVEACVTVNCGLVVKDGNLADFDALIGADALRLRENFNFNTAHLLLAPTIRAEQQAPVAINAVSAAVPLDLELELEAEGEQAPKFEMLGGNTQEQTARPECPRNTPMTEEERVEAALRTIVGHPKDENWIARARERLLPIAGVFTNLDHGTMWDVEEVVDPPNDIEGLHAVGMRHVPRNMAAHVARYVTLAVAFFCLVKVLVVDPETIAFGHLYGIPKPHGGDVIGDVQLWIEAALPRVLGVAPVMICGAVPEVALRALRLMRAFRPINDVSALNGFWKPLAPVELTPRDVLFLLGGGPNGEGASDVFGALDLVGMYNCIPISPELGRCLGVMRDGVQYRYCVLPQGWRNSPFHAQQALSKILGDYYQTKTMVKADDLLPHARGEDNYLDVLIETLTRLHRRKAQISLHKLQLACFNGPVVWNGLLVSKDGLKRSTREIDSLRRWLTTPPTNGAELSELIGQLEYFTMALPGAGSVMHPLRVALEACVQLSAEKSREARKLRRVKLDLIGGWNDTLQVCVEVIFDAITNRGEFHVLKPEYGVHIYSDASLHGHGWVALQYPTEKADLPPREREYSLVGAGQHAWTKAQSHWPTLDQEAYGVLSAVQQGAHLVYRPAGSPRTQVFTDHANVALVFKPGYALNKAQRTRITNWTAIMSDYIGFIDLFYIPGVENRAADWLSRDFGVAPVDGHAHLYAIDTRYALWGADAGHDVPTIAEISKASSAADAVGLGFKYNDQGFWSNDEGVIYIPYVSNLRERVMVSVHFGLGHVGLDAGLHVLLERVWWPKIREEYGQFHRACVHCLASRGRAEIRRPLGTPPRGKRPGEVWVADNKVYSHESAGYTAIAVHIDEFSGYVDLEPLERQGAANQASAFAKLCARFGVPRLLIHDGGSSFCNQLMELLSQQLGHAYHVTTAYHAQGHGRVENVIARIQRMVLALCSANKKSPEHWAYYVPQVQLALNTTPCRSLRMHTPFEIFHGGRKAVTPISHIVVGEEGEITPVIFPKDWDTLVAEAQAGATALWSQIESTHDDERFKRHARYKRQYEAKPLHAEAGTYVMILNKVASKAQHCWRGPARVVKQLDDLHLEVVYLNEPDQLVKVLATRCALYHDRTLRESPDLLEYARFLTPHYEVERIEEMVKRADGLYFSVKWVGYTNPTLTQARMLYDDVPTLVVDFLDAQNSKRQKLANMFRQHLGIARSA